jgi:chromosome segregation ATPase
LRNTPGKCTVGLTVLNRINECGLEPADIDHWPLILSSVESEEQPQEFVRIIYEIQEVREATGLSLEEFDDRVHDLERKAADLEPMAKQYDEHRQQIEELTGKREKLTTEVANLEDKYKLLNPRVKELEKRDEDLSRHVGDMEKRVEQLEKASAQFTKESLRLQGIGLSIEELTEFTQRIQSIARHHKITLAKLRERLLNELENLDRGIGLETLIENRKRELQEREQAITEVRQSSESLKTIVSDLKREKERLEVSIRTAREEVTNQIEKVAPMAETMIDGLNAALQRWQSDIYTDIGKIKDKAMEIGIELGRYRELYESVEILKDLIKLIAFKETLEARQVRTIILLVLCSTVKWLKLNENTNNRFSTLIFHAEFLIRLFREWQV